MFEVAEGGVRLDRFLTGVLGADAASRTAVQRAIRAGLVRVDGRGARGGERLRAGSRVEVDGLPEADRAPLVAEPIPLSVVYEDADMVVIDKPRGLVVHPAPGHWRGTLVHALLARYGSLEGVAPDGGPSPVSAPAAGSGGAADGGDGRDGDAPGGGDGEPGDGRSGEPPEADVRPGIVHRLDRDTSGLLIVARTARAGAALRAQIAAHRVVREYLAVARGRPPERFSVDAPIGRGADRRRMAVVEGGRPARTHASVRERFPGEPPYALLELRLETGRTHQIRVHLAAAGYPVACDALYGQPALDASAGLVLDGQALHAWRLRFAHPVDGRMLDLRADPPADFAAAMATLRRRDGGRRRST